MTYKQAREAIFAHIQSLHGWELHTKAQRYPCNDLKEPYAVTPSGNRVTFKPQAVYLGEHSLWLDIRTIPPATFIELVQKAEWRRDNAGKSPVASYPASRPYVCGDCGCIINHSSDHGKWCSKYAD